MSWKVQHRTKNWPKCSKIALAKIQEIFMADEKIRWLWTSFDDNDKDYAKDLNALREMPIKEGKDIGNTLMTTTHVIIGEDQDPVTSHHWDTTSAIVAFVNFGSSTVIIRTNRACYAAMALIRQHYPAPWHPPLLVRVTNDENKEGWSRLKLSVSGDKRNRWPKKKGKRHGKREDQPSLFGEEAENDLRSFGGSL